MKTQLELEQILKIREDLKQERLKEEFKEMQEKDSFIEIRKEILKLVYKEQEILYYS